MLNHAPPLRLNNPAWFWTNCLTLILSFRYLPHIAWLQQRRSAQIAQRSEVSAAHISSATCIAMCRCLSSAAPETLGVWSPVFPVLANNVKWKTPVRTMECSVLLGKRPPGFQWMIVLCGARGAKGERQDYFVCLGLHLCFQEERVETRETLKNSGSVSEL